MITHCPAGLGLRDFCIYQKMEISGSTNCINSTIYEINISNTG